MNVDLDDIDVKVLRLGPGDIVVLRPREPISGAQAERLVDHWDSRFPDVPCIVLDGLDIAVVKPEGVTA